MKKLNQLQKNYLAHLLDFVHDYNTFEDIGHEGQRALEYMDRNYYETSTNHDDLVNLVNKFIKKYRKQKEANQ
jgi:hypothetical protein